MYFKTQYVFYIVNAHLQGIRFFQKQNRVQWGKELLIFVSDKS